MKDKQIIDLLKCIQNTPEKTLSFYFKGILTQADGSRLCREMEGLELIEIYDIPRKGKHQRFNKGKKGNQSKSVRLTDKGKSHLQNAFKANFTPKKHILMEDEF